MVTRMMTMKKSGDEEDKKIDDNSKSFFWGKR